jgi:phosphate transport system substrate-binding protein
MTKTYTGLLIGFLVMCTLKSYSANIQKISVDGSSTVFPITEAVAEEFGKENPDIRVVVGTSGTGGGFKKFALGEIDINDASRKIKDSEAAAAKDKNIGFIGLPVGYDGITIVVNTANNWVDKLTVEELKKLWAPGSKVNTWKDLRSTWPNRKIKLYGPGTDSGTFDFFTEAINGKAQSSRADFTKSEDDNVLVQGVEGDKDSLGYFGYSYYVTNMKKLKALPIDNGSGVIGPNTETIRNNTYSPLSRLLYIYVSSAAAKRSEVKKFVNYYLVSAEKLVKEVGYVPLDKKEYEKAQKDFSKF